MKKIKAIKIICLMWVITLCMTACGLANEVGNYTIDTVTTMGIEMDRDDLKNMGIEIKLTLNKDGTGILTYRDEDMEVTWENGVLTLGDEPKPYEYKEGTLTITHSEKDIWVFEKN